MKAHHCFAVIFVFGGSCFAEDTDTTAIRKLVPLASAISLSDWDQLATSSSPSATKIESKSLSLVLMTLRITSDEKRSAQFQYLGDRPPKPHELAKEMTKHVRGRGRLRIALGPVTMIQADRITDFACKIEGDKASGVVTFKVPNLYEGKVNYVANRVDDKWQIKGFAIPAYQVRIARSDKGIWKRTDPKGDQ